MPWKHWEKFIWNAQNIINDAHCITKRGDSLHHEEFNVWIGQKSCGVGCGTRDEFLKKYKEKDFDKTFTMNFVCCTAVHQVQILADRLLPQPMELLFRSRRRHRLAEILATKFHAEDAFHLAENDVIWDSPKRSNVMNKQLWVITKFTHLPAS